MLLDTVWLGLAPCDIIIAYWSLTTHVDFTTQTLIREMPPPRHRRRLTTEELARGIGMLETGLSQRHVANSLGVSQSVISRAWNRYVTFGSVTQRHAGGRRRSTTEREDRLLVIQARRQRFVTATRLRNELASSGINISTQTIRNRLHEGGLRSRRACIRIPLTRRQRRKRLNWAEEHVTWTDQDCRPVLFTDESRYCLEFTDRRVRVWRRPGERFQEASVAEHDRYGGGSIMVWGGISRTGRTGLHVVRRGTMTSVRYIDDLDVYVRPYAGAIGADFLLIDECTTSSR